MVFSLSNSFGNNTMGPELAKPADNEALMRPIGGKIPEAASSAESETSFATFERLRELEQASLAHVSMHQLAGSCLHPLDFSLFLDADLKDESGSVEDELIKQIHDGRLVLFSQTLVNDWDKWEFLDGLCMEKKRVFKQVKGGFFLIVPAPLIVDGLHRLGFHTRCFTELTPKGFFAQEKRYFKSASMDDIEVVLNSEWGPEKRIALYGTGSYAKGKLDIVGDGTADGVIAGFAIEDYQRMLDYFAVLKVSFLFVNSHYAGGLHAMEHHRSALPSGEIPPCPYTIVVHSISDETVSFPYSVDTLFTLLSPLLGKLKREEQLDLDEVQSLYDQFIPYFSEAPLIFFPHKDLLPQKQRGLYLNARREAYELTAEVIRSLVSNGKRSLHLSTAGEDYVLLYATQIPMDLYFRDARLLQSMRSMVPGHARHLIKKIFIPETEAKFLANLHRTTYYSVANKAFFISKIHFEGDESPWHQVCIELTAESIRLLYWKEGVYYHAKATLSPFSEVITPFQITHFEAVCRLQQCLSICVIDSDALHYASEGKESLEGFKKSFQKVFAKTLALPYISPEELLQSLSKQEKDQLFLMLLYRSDFTSLLDLLKQGLQMPAVDSKGESPLYYFIKLGQEDLFNLALTELDLEYRNPRGRTALFYAVEEKNEVMVQALLEASPNLLQIEPDALALAEHLELPEILTILKTVSNI